MSVVVPVWNPGPNIKRCLDGLLGQTMPADEYEIVLVDDGSTDGTGALLDTLARRDNGPHVEIVHIPNSGWPGRPRNVGVDHARGEFVHFVDNDDTLAASALDALYEFGRRCDADVVIGKPASDFRYMSHRVYRRNVLGTMLTESPWLVETLTPHKMFRRAMLVEHDIRHPEGPVPFEDQIFVMQAYVHARSVAILADRACYYYLRRIGSGRNAGDRRIDIAAHTAAIGRVLDIIDAGVTDPDVRDRLYRRFYRTSVIGPVVGPAMIDYEPGFRAELMTALRELVTSRFAPGVHAGCGAAHRMQGRMLVDDDAAGLVAHSEVVRRISLRVTTPAPQWRDGALPIVLDGELRIGDEPLRCERVGDGWALPKDWAPQVPDAERMLDDDRNAVDIELSVVSRVDHEVSFPLVDGLDLRVDDAGLVKVTGTVALDPMTAMGGAPLADGVWELRLRLSFAGINRMAPVRCDVTDNGGEPPELAPFVTTAGGPVVPFWTSDRSGLALDIGQWAHALAEVLADRIVLSPAADGGLELTLPIEAAGQPPATEVLLRPVDGTEGDLITLPLAATAGGRPTMTASGATPPADGVWRAFLAIDGSAQPPETRLPWVIRTAQGALSVERAAD